VTYAQSSNIKRSKILTAVLAIHLGIIFDMLDLDSVVKSIQQLTFDCIFSCDLADHTKFTSGHNLVMGHSLTMAALQQDIQ